jgi:hypothetical protein
MKTLAQNTANGAATTPGSGPAPAPAAGPSNGGHPLDKAPLPYWLDRPCPPWCMITVSHQDHEARDDRLHQSASYEIDLTLQPPHDFKIGGKVVASGPAHLTVGLWQHYLQRDPYVCIIINDSDEISLSPPEAAELARLLTASPSDRYTTITLTLEDPEDDLPPQPWSASGPPRPFARPAVLAVMREYRDRVILFSRGRYLVLTLSEAEELCTAVNELLAGAL